MIDDLGTLDRYVRDDGWHPARHGTPSSAMDGRRMEAQMRQLREGGVVVGQQQEVGVDAARIW